MKIFESLCYKFSFKERDQEIEALSAALDTQSVPTPAPKANTEGLRRSERLTGTDLCRLRAELDQCRAELLTKTQGAVSVKHCSDYLLEYWL